MWLVWSGNVSHFFLRFFSYIWETTATDTLLQKSKIESDDGIAERYLPLNASFACVFVWNFVSKTNSVGHIHLHTCTKRLSITIMRWNKSRWSLHRIMMNACICNAATLGYCAALCEGRVLFAFMRTYECVTINYMQSVTWAARLNTYIFHTMATNDPSNS